MVRATKIPESSVQPPFAFGCSVEVFPPNEIAALQIFGRELEALAAGLRSPTSDEQKHFLLVDREEAEPQTLLERAWVRLKGRREYEAENNVPKALEPTVDYGMVDFDFDRCWW